MPERISTTAYLLTGSNVGNRQKFLETAIEMLQANCGIVTSVSFVYETAAWGNEDQAPFLNQAICLQTSLTAKQLIREVLEIEKAMGRVREAKYGPRIIDIDILLFGDVVIHTPELIIPHPELPNRRFALQPLADIAADVQHPLLHKSIQQLLEICPDKLDVHKIE